MKFSMQSLHLSRKALTLITLVAGFAASVSSQATVVQIHTVKGDIEIDLFDHDPAVKATVDNFLKYVKNLDTTANTDPDSELEYGSYTGTIIHRSESLDDSEGHFIIQGGGFAYYDALPLATVKAGPRITNQPVYSNLRGTIAMAKIGGYPDSASSQWFINLDDNDKILDNNNGGFTVFGKVRAEDMQILTDIKAIDRFNMGNNTPFRFLPLMSYTSEDYRNNVIPDSDNFVTTTFLVLNEDPNSSANLNPVKNTLVNEKDDSSGSINLLLLGLLALIALGRKFQFNKG